jgi:hypothetical protein
MQKLGKHRDDLGQPYYAMSTPLMVKMSGSIQQRRLHPGCLPLASYAALACSL